MIGNNSLGLEFEYLTVNDMDRKFGLWVNTVGYQSIPPDLPYPLREHPSGYFFNAEGGRVLHEYQLVCITKGRGLSPSDSTSGKQIRKGRLMVLFPGQWHTYHPLRQIGWTEYYIGFEGPMIGAIVNDAFLSQEQQILEIGINEELVSLFSHALVVAEADKISAQQYLSGIVFHIIGMIPSVSKNKVFEISDMDQKIERTKIIISENASGNVDPEELTIQLNISYSWFRRVFKEHTGCAPVKYLQELKLRKAKQMLIGAFQPVKEISFFLGFQSVEYFFSFFKKHTGLTPLECRSFGREE